VTIAPAEISHARRRRRGRATPGSFARAAVPSSLAQSARAPHDRAAHDRAREAGPVPTMAGVATLHASFADLGVPGPLAGALAGAGLTVSFPIQAATLPDALAGRDILGRGRTGSGKTLGFSIPLVAGLADGFTSAGRPRGLVLVPTRGAGQPGPDRARAAGPGAGPGGGRHFRRYRAGCAGNGPAQPCDIVVACPGRLADLIEQGHCHLGDVEISVLDEADHMAGLGFLPVVRRLMAATPRQSQRMLFSATLDNAVDVLVRQFLSDPAVHAVDSATAAPGAMVHHLLTVAPGDRVGVVAALAGGSHRSLVFTRTKHGAQKLARQLARAGVSVVELHGNLGQGARERNLASFASGVARVLVATDIAARGIHVDAIGLVIHADPPAEHKAYLHRSGRTARAGADGVVITLQSPAQAADVRGLMRRAGVSPLAAAVSPGSALLRSIAGPPAARAASAEPPAAAAAAAASPATGRGAVAMSAGYRGRGRR
jgi:superfamily II DNA/RNA helicase